MLNRGGVGAVFARGRAPLIFALLLLGGGLLLRRDIAGPDALQNKISGAALSNPQQIRAALGRLPMSFEPNQGQSGSRVRFLAHGSGYGLYLTSTEAVLALPQRSKAQGRPLVEMQFGGANQAAQVAGTNRLPGRSNYFIGNDPSHWYRNIQQFSRVQYRDLYPGIDLDFYGKQGRLEYDFEVSPGADPNRIDLDFKGTKNLQIAGNGGLVLTIDGGELRFEAPHFYQKNAGGTQAVAGSFALRSDNRVAFQVGDYDRSRTLIIDPVLTFSTYLGGSGDESCGVIVNGTQSSPVAHCPAIAVDSASRVYVAGATTSAGTFSGVAPNPIPTNGPLSSTNVFVTRLNSTGTAIDYVTYLGGSGAQYATGVGVDSGFNVYVAGATSSSTDFPTTTATAVQPGPVSTGTHAFFSKLDSSGSANLYTTYLAGSGTDIASALAVDSLGLAYVFGTTTSPAFPTASGFPTTPGSLQPTANAVDQFFFSKINPGLSGTNSLPYSTFIGGSTPATGAVTGGAIAVDSTFNVYLAGGTNFTDMGPTWIVNAFQGTFPSKTAAGSRAVWGAKLTAPANNTQLYTLNYGTYFGGNGDEVAYGIATDGTNAYITGSTNSTNITIPTGTTPFQKCLDDPTNPTTCNTTVTANDAFIAKFGVPTTTGTTQGSVPLSYFTYLGGTANDAGLAIVADSLSDARVTGLTQSSDFPNSSPLPPCSPVPPCTPPSGTNAFVGRIVTTSASTTNINSTSILGGSGTDIGTSIALDSSLNDYVAGETSSGDFVPPGVIGLSNTLSGATDAFVSKLGPTVSLCFSPPPAPCPTSSPATVSPSPVGVGNQVTFKYSIYNTGDPVTGVLFTDTLGPGSTFVSAAPSPGTCPTTALNGIVVCNLGTIPTSVTTTSGTTTTTAPAATITVVVTSTVPTVTGVMPPPPPPISNSASLSTGAGSLPTSATGTAIVNDFGIKIVGLNSQTVTAGAPAAYTVQVTPTGSGFPESVSLTCGSGLPSGANCTFTNNPIPNMSNGPQSRPFEITTTARVTTPGSLFRPGPIYAIWFPVSGLAIFGAGISRRRRLLLGVFLAAVLGVVLLQAGCGSSSSNNSTTTGTPAGTYTITINATSVAVRTTTVQLTVN